MGKIIQGKQIQLYRNKEFIHGYENAVKVINEHFKKLIGKEDVEISSKREMILGDEEDLCEIK